MRVFNENRKLCFWIGIVFTVVLAALYLYALFLPGVWHRDAFLYKQKDGSFVGSDSYADYKMRIEPADDGTDIDFTVNERTRQYRIVYDSTDVNMNAEILENNVSVFKGKAVVAGDTYILIDNNDTSVGTVSVIVSGVTPAIEELFPNYTRLFNLAVAEEYDTRGNPYMLFLILLFAIFLFLDIKFPDLFWILEHRLEVDGGEPSDWYRFGQKIGNVLLVIGILVCVILTFTTH